MTKRPPQYGLAGPEPSTPRFHSKQVAPTWPRRRSALRILPAKRHCGFGRGPLFPADDGV
jgi:hypothetical protein